jgi:hypothetical protein
MLDKIALFIVITAFIVFDVTVFIFLIAVFWRLILNH